MQFVFFKYVLFTFIDYADMFVRESNVVYVYIVNSRYVFLLLQLAPDNKVLHIYQVYINHWFEDILYIIQ